MSENVEAFKRGDDAINRRDIDALLEVLDADIEWHDVFHLMLGGRAMVYRGHDGVRDLFADLFDAFAEVESKYSDFRDVGDLVVALGRLHAHGKESGAETESPVASLVEFRDGRAIWIQTYLDHQEALDAAAERA